MRKSYHSIVVPRKHETSMRRLGVLTASLLGDEFDTSISKADGKRTRQNGHKGSIAELAKPYHERRANPDHRCVEHNTCVPQPISQTKVEQAVRASRVNVDRFNRDYYRRFYSENATAVTSRAEMRARGRLIAAYVELIGCPTRSILDAGCGMGLLRPALLRTLPHATYTGL
jgi:hypothetical protein